MNNKLMLVTGFIILAASFTVIAADIEMSDADTEAGNWRLAGAAYPTGEGLPSPITRYLDTTTSEDLWYQNDYLTIPASAENYTVTSSSPSVVSIGTVSYAAASSILGYAARVIVPVNYETTGTSTLTITYTVSTVTYTKSITINVASGSAVSTTYYLYFDKGDVSLASNIPPTQSSTTSYGSAYVYVYNSTPTSTGYTFLYWLNPSDNQTYSPGDSVLITLPDTSVTLVAQWTVNTYTITFDATTNGGTLSGSATKTVTYGQTYGTLPTATKSGYYFAGWFTNSSGGTQIFDDSIVEITSDKTFYAQFTSDPAISIHIGDWDFWSYRTVINNVLSSWSEFKSTSDTVNIQSGASLSIRWYSNNPTNTNTNYVSSISKSLYGISIGSSVTIVGNDDFYPSKQPCQFLIQNDIGGTVSVICGGWNTETVASGNEVYLKYPTNEQIAVMATPLSDYAFDYWTISNGVGQVYDNPATVNILQNTNMTITSSWIEGVSYTITFDPNGGTVSQQTKIVTYNQPYGQLPTPTKSGSEFIGWYTSPTGGSLVTAATTVPYIASGTQTLYAHWSEISSGEVKWNNRLYNGTIRMVFQYEPSQNYDHLMVMDLYSGTTLNNETVWSTSGYTLEVKTSYPALYVTATLKHNGLTVSTNQIRTGNWSTFQLTIDTAEGKVDVTPVNKFNSFIDYTVYESQTRTVLDWSNTIKGLTVYEITHSDDTSTGSNPVRFSVTSTDVFLETYGVILNNPSINVFDYFPQYSSVRLNFYSFALYGNSITVNGITYNLSGANVTVSYVNDADNNHYLPSAFPNQSVKTKTMELSNIYVTWNGDNGHCYLTFVNYNFTIDLGEYIIGNETVSFGGLWYFTTQLFEPIQSSQIEIGGWESLPTLDKSQMCLIFLGLLILFGAFAYTKLNASMFDTVIIIAAAVIGFVFLGS